MRRRSRWTLVALLALGVACDQSRVRPGAPGTVPTRRPDAAAEADAGAARDAEAQDGAAEAADGGEGGALDGSAVHFDATPGPERAGADDAAPVGADAAPVGVDAAPVGADAAPGVDAPAAAPDAAVPSPRDGGVAGDAGTPACTADTQCASGRCHPLYGQCVPAGQRAGCEPCATDAECGLPTDHCLDVFAGATFLERVCAQGCRGDADCQRGYACTLSGHCYPIAGTIRPHTCASLRDMFARASCNPLSGADTCGIPGYDDGTCVPTLGCSVGCDTVADCPERSSCVSYVVASYCVPQ